jgi:excinuclease UvrABC ATPase subunit
MILSGLLYARAGIAHCYQCGQPILAQTIDEMVEAVMQRPKAPGSWFSHRFQENRRAVHPGC